MSRLISLKTLLAAGIVAAGFLSFGNAAADAGCPARFVSNPYTVPVTSCHSDVYVPRCTYKTVIDSEFRTC
jgi:hypothetical protein